MFFHPCFLFFYIYFQDILTYYFAQVSTSEGQCHEESREEMKPDSQLVDTVITEAKENGDVDIKLKNVTAALQKELKEFGHWKNNEDKEETARHMTSVSVSSKVSCIVY
jgi:uncharacterized protein with WD repeat